MSDKQTKLNIPSPLESFTRGLLSTTCLTVVCGSGAVAGTVTELQPNVPNSSPGILLPVGTTTVNSFAGRANEGFVVSPDWFEFQGLTPGLTFVLTGSYNPLGMRSESGNGESGLTLNVFTSSLSPLFQNQSFETSGGGTGVSVSGTVPSNGILEVEVISDQPSGFGSPEMGLNFENAGGSTYQLNLSQEGASSTTPEPGTLATVGLALGALAWSRKRRQ